MSSDSSDNEGNQSKYRKQKFRPEWLQITEFKGWLTEVKDDQFKCKCRACGKILNCGKSELRKHSLTKLHKKNVSGINNLKPLESFFEKRVIEKDPVSNFEMRISLFFAEHNVALHVVDHLVPLLKEIVPDSSIIKNSKLGRTKCTKIIQNVLAEEEKSKLILKLQKYEFSVLVDESTDISSSKTMCVLVKFFDEEKELTVVQLLDLLPVGTDCTADALYKMFKECMLKYSIPFSNIRGLCCDGANVMAGKFNSFSSRLLNDNKEAITIKCICHTSAIIANKACLNLPKAPEELIRQIATYIMGSSKRCAELEDFQQLFNEEKRKILRISVTRWLSRQKCIERILSNWNVLQEYFKYVCDRDKLKSAELIYAELNNDCTKAYLLFLKYVLNYFNNINALFQAKKLLIHVLHSESIKSFLKLAQNCIKKSELKANCSVRSQHILLPIKEIFVGHECEELLKKLPEEKYNEIKSYCLEFYLTALQEIQNRFPLDNDSIFREMGFLNPENVFGEKKDEFKFELLSKKFNISLNDLMHEWRTIEYNFSTSEINMFLKIDMEQFWIKIIKMKNFNDEIVFPNLSKLVRILFALPHANADAERIFSIITDVRTKKRNKLSHTSLSSICILRSFLQDSGKDCINFECTDSHFRKLNSKELY